MHRIKIDENNPESEYEQYLFDPKADLRDIPKYMETEHFGNGGNRSGNAAPKRFLVMTTLERPKTASEKDAAIRKCRLKDKHHEDGLVDPYNFAERSAREYWKGGNDNYYKFDFWCGRERPPPHLVLTEGEKALLSQKNLKSNGGKSRGAIKLSPINRSPRKRPTKSPSVVYMQRPRTSGSDPRRKGRITSRTLPRAPQPILKTVSRFGGEIDPYGIQMRDLWENDSVPSLGEKSTSRFNSHFNSKLSGSSSLGSLSASMSLSKLNFDVSKTKMISINKKDALSKSKSGESEECDEETNVEIERLKSVLESTQLDHTWNVGDLVEVHTIDHQITGKWRRARIVALKNGGTVDVRYQISGLCWFRFRVLQVNIRRPPQFPHAFEMAKVEGNSLNESRKALRKINPTDLLTNKSFDKIENLEELTMKEVEPTVENDKIVEDDFYVSPILKGWVEGALSRDKDMDKRMNNLEIHVPDRLHGAKRIIRRDPMTGAQLKISIKKFQNIPFEFLNLIAMFLSFKDFESMSLTCTHYCLISKRDSKIWKQLCARDCKWVLKLRKERIRKEITNTAHEKVAYYIAKASRQNIEEFHTLPDWFHTYDDSVTLSINGRCSLGKFTIVDVMSSRDPSQKRKLGAHSYKFIDGMLSYKYLYKAIAWATRASYQVLKINAFIKAQDGLTFYKDTYERLRIICDLRAHQAAEKIKTVVNEPCLKTAQAFLVFMDGAEKNRGDEIFKGKYASDVNVEPDWCLIWERFRKKLANLSRFINSIENYEIDKIDDKQVYYARKALDSPCFQSSAWLKISETEGYYLIDAVRRWARSVLWYCDVQDMIYPHKERKEKYETFLKKIGTALRLGVGQALG